MKKIALITTLLTLTSASFAATTGTLQLRGVVQQRLSIAVTAESGATTLDLSASPTDLKVATLNEKNNSKTIGYKVNIKSAKLGNLERVGGTETLPYTLKYNGSAVNISTAAGSDVASAATGSVVNTNKDVAISYTGAAAESMVEGTYEDLLTFTISSN